MLDGGKSIKVVDQDGKTFYQGPVRDDGNYPGLSDEVKTLLKDSTKDGKLGVLTIKNAKPTE